MFRRSAGWLTLAIAAAVSLAACTSTTSGQGQHIAISTPTTSATGLPSTPATTPTSASPSHSPTQKIIPAPAHPIKVATITGFDGTKYQVSIWQRRDDPTCVGHAYGQPVIDFLNAHPCYAGVTRLLATITINGREAAFAQSSLSIPSPGSTDPYKNSAAFKKLLQENNTGSIIDLLHDGYRLPKGPTAIPAHEAFTVFGQDSGIEIWDGWWLDGPTKDNDPVLIKAAMDIYLQY